jgi:hypothetical protein
MPATCPVSHLLELDAACMSVELAGAALRVYGPVWIVAANEMESLASRVRLSSAAVPATDAAAPARLTAAALQSRAVRLTARVIALPDSPLHGVSDVNDSVRSAAWLAGRDTAVEVGLRSLRWMTDALGAARI